MSDPEFNTPTVDVSPNTLSKLVRMEFDVHMLLIITTSLDMALQNETALMFPNYVVNAKKCLTQCYQLLLRFIPRLPRPKSLEGELEGKLIIPYDSIIKS